VNPGLIEDIANPGYLMCRYDMLAVVPAITSAATIE